MPPPSGGANVVSRENLGEKAALTAAAALLVDYVMTVAVSVTSGVVAITSAIPTLYAVILAVGLIVLLTLANLRGTRESGRVFAVAHLRLRRTRPSDVCLGRRGSTHLRAAAGVHRS